uniref:Dual specificity phosphatase catalytic domain-containing protein n=1 Tax=viral metagenome TaxID=1070528 RepID=A0A6C0FBH8_9ZZZZ|tara:strand:+ start:1325 stop:1741 length:417 start_codon:yes stop_codon:yes gene_type:complete
MPTEILSGLWIGDINDSFNKEFISDNLINIFINCTLDYGFPNINEIKKLRIPLSQNLDPNRDIQLLYENSKKIIEYIKDISEENNILIYCYDGLTISPIIIALYIVNNSKIGLDNIREIIRSKNERICLDINLSIFLK